MASNKYRSGAPGGVPEEKPMARKSLAEKYYSNKRQKELFVPIDRQIMMTDDVEDLILLATMMLKVARDVIIERMGTERAIAYIRGLE